MDFNKLILGEHELQDFENLLLREKIIDSARSDIKNLIDMNEEYNQAKAQRINNKKKLLIFLMLYEKIDATNVSAYDYSRLIDLGIIDSASCLVNGTDNGHVTSKILGNAWNCKHRIISTLYQITDAIFKAINIEIYSRNLVKEEYFLDLCDSCLYGSKSDFLLEYRAILRKIWEMYIKKLYSNGSSIYGHSLVDDSIIFNRLDFHIIWKHEIVYKLITMSNESFEDIKSYEQFNKKLDAYIQTYLISESCLNCDSNWKQCCLNSEFTYYTSFSCPQRENLGVQKYAKLNGLILSNTEHATLFDNSLKFQYKKEHFEKLIEEIYYIVNVDLSKVVNSLPVPQNIDEALRLRKREEIVSLRNIFLTWSQYLYDGNIDEAQYIKKSFDDAVNYFEKRKKDSNRQKSILHCCFEALGNQVPYIANLVGLVTPFINRKKLLEEERYKWFLLTR